jgi:hypothetical protein
VEKTRRLAKIPGANRWLNVCVAPSPDGKNCSTCKKCCRTLLTLEILGLLDDFKQVFSLDKWAGVRNRYLIWMLGDKNDPLFNEIKEYANSVGYSFKPWHLVASKSLHFTADNLGLSQFKYFKISAYYITRLLSKLK